MDALMHAAGAPLERIADYIGHSSSYMIDRYRHVIGGAARRDAERLEARMTGVQTA
jgi:hypothetical protein